MPFIEIRWKLRIVDYCLRMKDQKRFAVKAFNELKYHSIAWVIPIMISIC
ncbi:MAG: hypothetical protein CM1200mP28_07660 [Deltaproteobacteria bacterium]|nr:MAG: hypothetical protein CM1200mP28_07660 [Deltaproteobacteria bacterium]